jgi:hypothetical protein
MIDSILSLILRKFNFNKNDDSVVLAVQTFELINKYLKNVGMHVFADNFSLSNVPFYLANCDLFTYLAINFYSVYMVWGDLLAVSFCLVTLGYGFQVKY